MRALTIVLALAGILGLWVGYRSFFSSPFEGVERIVEREGKSLAAEMRIRLMRCAIEEGHAIAGGRTFERQSECDALFHEAGDIFSVEDYAIHSHNAAIEYCYGMRGLLNSDDFDACIQRTNKIGAALR